MLETRWSSSACFKSGGSNMEVVDRPRIKYLPLFDELPFLLEGIPKDRQEHVRRTAFVPATSLRQGPWKPPWSDQVLGVLPLSGALSRETGRFGRVSIEFLGPGDPVLCTNGTHENAEQVRWKALVDTDVVLISPELMNTLISLPGVIRLLWQRSEDRHRQAMLGAIAGSITRVPASLFVALWDLAKRFGVPGPNGVTLPFQLDGEALGALAATNRTTASRALASLIRAGLISRTPDRRFVLSGSPPVGEADLILVLGGLGETAIAS
jgi:CRP-like cAMP-binding protein